MDLERFPGGELIVEGIADLGAGRVTIAALLVTIGADRMRRAGLEIPHHEVEDPEIRLYQMLAASDSDSAHSRYNALIRRLVSFERAVECAA
jgi:hypothetical protein